MKDAEEPRVSDVLAAMKEEDRRAIDIICSFASGKLKTKTPEVISAAERIRYTFDETERKVVYYLIGCAEADLKTPSILYLY